jgi:protein-L-isoaspartate O-methyltransferase
MLGSHTASQLLREIEARVGLLSERHRRAFLGVDRARHVRDVDRAYAWRDMPLPLDTPHGPAMPPVDALIAQYGSYAGALFSPAFKDVAATISAPGIYAACYQLLGLDEGHRLLELGTGTGYGAALAAEIVGASGCVTSVEVDPILVRAARERVSAPNVRLLHDDGLARADLVAAHDRICVTFAVERLPQRLLDALQEGALLIAPVGPHRPDWPPTRPDSPDRIWVSPQASGLSLDIGQRMMRYRRVGGRLDVEGTIPVMFIAARPLVPEAGQIGP